MTDGNRGTSWTSRSLSKKAGGDGTIQYRVKVTKLVTFPSGPIDFVHPMHEGDWRVRSVMTFSTIQKWRLLLHKLTSYDGSPLNPKRLLNEFIPILDPHPVSS